jgi:hypothetical protein
MSGGECLPLGHVDSVVAYDHQLSRSPRANRE